MQTESLDVPGEIKMEIYLKKIFLNFQSKLRKL